MTQQLWVVTFHFNRGHAQTNWFESKLEAEEAVRITVFSNEDCINCSIYKQDVQKSKALKALETAKKMIELKERVVATY